MSTWALVLLASLQPMPKIAPPASISMHHMVRDGVIRPPRAHYTVEWFCPGEGKASKIRISAEDTGKGPRNYQFTFKLIDLRVNGRRPTSETIEKVRSLLASLSSISTFEGACRQAIPNIFIKGHTLEELKRPAREYRFDLK